MNNKQLATTVAFASVATLGMITTASADSAGQVVYTVQPGDTLSKIAQQYHVSVAQIAQDNQIKDVNVIYVGQQLKILTGPVTQAAAPIAVPQQTIATASVQPEAPVASSVEKEKKAPVQPAQVAKPAAQPAPALATPTPTPEQVTPKQVAKQVAKPEPKPAPVVAPVQTQPIAVTEPAMSAVAEVQAPAVPADEPAMTVPTQQQVQKIKQVEQRMAQMPNVGGSVYDQFIAAGGTHNLWHHVVMPESTGNPNAISPNGYRGLGQTKEAWGSGSVHLQTQGMLNYAVNRYGSVENAIAFRQANGWW